MLTMLGNPRRCCDGVTRRESLKVGALSLLGGAFDLPNLLRAEARHPAGARPGKAKSVILLYLAGGAATQDMWDLKPDAPAGIRSEYRPIATSVPGMQVGELLPRTARWMHKVAVVRSVNYRGGGHNPLPSYTGYDVPLADVDTARDTYPPSMGSVCEFLRRGRGELPDYVYLPSYLGWGNAVRAPGPYAGFLGKRYDPLFTECLPYNDSGRREVGINPSIVRGTPFLPDAALDAEITVDRLDRRHSLLQQLDGEQRRVEQGSEPASYDRARQRAFSLLTSTRIKSVFDLRSEDRRLIDRYGGTLFGNSTLLARRLVEAGVRFVNVTWESFTKRFGLGLMAWDTHWRHYPVMTDVLLPNFDRTYSALLEDLDCRGLLDETLVVVMSEIGRTPQMVQREFGPGRDHWTGCYSVVLAGAGIRGGTVYGASDAHAAFVRDRPVSPADVCATIYRCLGIDHEMIVRDRSGRPLPIAHGGRPIDDILA